MIYLDTSVALAQLLSEDRRPPESLWAQSLVSSRLLEYEMWNRVHARALARTHAEALRALLARITFIELDRRVVARAVDPFPAAVRTLDALHLASADFLRSHGQLIEVASYDARLNAAARAMGFAIHAV